MKRLPHPIMTTAIFSLLAAGAAAAHADTTVQVPMGALLDKRSVIVLQGQTIVPFTLTIDGGGGDIGTGDLQNGFATKAVAMLKNAAEVANCVPDDGHFPEDANHPDVVLNFSNAAAATAGQVHMIPPMGGTFSFPVPAATYSKFFVFLHSADNGAMVKITLTFSDATTQVVTAMVPDFYNAPIDAAVFVLAPNLAKWGMATTLTEANHHNIFGVSLTPTAGKTLTTVQIDHPSMGYLVFWGATGVATSAVGGLDGGAGDAATTGAGGSDAGAVGGASGGAGATGSAGASGTAGATGGAGVSGTAGAVGGGGSAGETSGSAGAAGTAGSTGGTGVMTKPGSSSGCSYGDGGSSTRASWLALGVVGMSLLRRRRRG